MLSTTGFSDERVVDGREVVTWKVAHLNVKWWHGLSATEKRRGTTKEKRKLSNSPIGAKI